jgi:hypothetical protein
LKKKFERKKPIISERTVSIPYHAVIAERAMAMPFFVKVITVCVYGLYLLPLF